MYNDMWVGGKCTYKLEPVVAEGGELIIYAPHIKEVSVTHGATIRRIGYHVRDYFLKQMDRFRDVPGGILGAHKNEVAIVVVLTLSPEYSLDSYLSLYIRSMKSGII